MRSILVPVDGSPLSETAIPMACAIARRHGRAPVEVVSVFTPHSMTVQTQGDWLTEMPVKHDLAALTRQYLNREVERAAAEAPDISIRATVLEGLPADAIVARVREVGHDQVVMTTHGRSGVSRFWLGSVADRVVRHCAAPVLLLRGSVATTPATDAPLFPRVLVPVGDLASETMIQEAMSLAGEGSLLHLLHVVVPSYALPPGTAVEFGAVRAVVDGLPADLLGVTRDAAIRRLDTLADVMRGTGLEVQTHVWIHAHPARAILDLAHDVDARLIAMAAHGRHGFGRLILGSVSDKVLRGAEVPVLVQAPVPPT